MTRGRRHVNPGRNVVGMVRAGRNGPARPEIDQLGFDAFHLEPQCRAAGEKQRHDPRRRLRLCEIDGQKIEDRILFVRHHIAALAGQDAFEAQGCEPSPVLGMRGLCRLPVEAPDRQDQPVLLGPPVHVRDLHDRVLQMCGDDLDVFLVERDQLQQVHGGARNQREIHRDVGNDGPKRPQDVDWIERAAFGRGKPRPRLAGALDWDGANREGRGEVNERVEGVGVAPRDVLLAQDGLSFLKAIVERRLPTPPIADLLGFALVEVERGRAVFAGVPAYRHYNPIGVVHGGYAATLLDSAVGCAVHSTLQRGEAYTTLELKLNLVRPITQETGQVLAEGRILHRGRTVGTAEGYLRDAAGKLYAHATTTCMIFPAPAG